MVATNAVAAAVNTSAQNGTIRDKQHGDGVLPADAAAGRAWIPKCDAFRGYVVSSLQRPHLTNATRTVVTQRSALSPRSMRNSHPASA